MYVCNMSLCTRIQTYACACLHAYMNIHLPTYICMYASMCMIYVCMYMYTCLPIYRNMYVCLYTYLNVYIYIEQMHAHTFIIHTYIYRYIHTPYAYTWLPAYMYACEHMYTKFIYHSSNNSLSAEQKASRLSSYLQHPFLSVNILVHGI